MAGSVQNIVENLADEMPNNLFAQYINQYFADRSYIVESNQNAIRYKVKEFLNFYSETKTQINSENSSIKN